MKFNLIKNINIEEGISNIYNKIFLTFDVDWATDEVLNYLLSIIEKYNIFATIFCTHETPLLKKMRENINIEIGIHPNFNLLLNGDFSYGENISEVINTFKKIVPEAISARSHSMTQSTQILHELARHGIKFDCNHFIPEYSGIKLTPWKIFDIGIIKVPFFWEDDFHCLYKLDWDIERYINKSDCIMVFNFHPIHIFLNTENYNRYLSCKDYLNDFKKLSNHINKKSYGIRNFFIDLIEMNKNA